MSSDPPLATFTTGIASLSSRDSSQAPWHIKDVTGDHAEVLLP